MKTCAYGTSFLLAFAIGGWDTDSFSLASAVRDGLLTTLLVAVVLAAAIAFGPIALTGGLTFIGTACAVALVSVVCGLVVGTYSGLGNGAEIEKGNPEEAEAGPGRPKKEDDEDEPIEKIRSVSHYIDVYFEPRDDDDSQAKDFVCLFVTYDDTLAGKPERKARIVADNAGVFYNEVRNYLENWQIRRLKQDAGREHGVYTLRAFTEDPYPGDGTYTQFKMIAEQKDIKVIRNEGKWTSAIP